MGAHTRDLDLGNSTRIWHIKLSPTCIEHQFIIALNGNFVNCVLNGSSSIVQLQFSLEIHQTYGIMQGGFA